MNKEEGIKIELEYNEDTEEITLPYETFSIIQMMALQEGKDFEEKFLELLKEQEQEEEGINEQD